MIYNTESIYYEIERKNQFFIINVFEAYEGVASAYTVDKNNNIIEFMVHKTRLDEFFNIMNFFEKKRKIVRRLDALSDKYKNFSSD
ncbi:MAG: hypothetical protein ACQESP_01165 [Candidatus Muiribacteriota bacterium]